ncbi:hypothetical protein ACJIZ3_006265 [Penstemon smallii]|uniref:MSP domain-containing protein n=1 Tax=Penstemon smallii TaxID=265156 RepID=A0ABD3S7H8_9LAMI
MEKLLYMKTHVKNKTKSSVIMFDVDKRLFPRVVLEPGETMSVNTHRIHNHCKINGNEWTIRVLINKEFTGIVVKPGHLICLTRLVFKDPCTTEEQIFDICMEGTREKSIDRLLRLRWIGHVFGRNTNWEKRDYSRIAVAKSNDNDVGGVQAINQLVAPLARNDTNLPQRQTAFSGGDICDKTSSVVPPDEEQIKEMLSPPHASTMATSSVHMHVTHNITINIPNQLIIVLSLGLTAVFTSMLLAWV